MAMVLQKKKTHTEKKKKSEHNFMSPVKHGMFPMQELSQTFSPCTH